MTNGAHREKLSVLIIDDEPDYGTLIPAMLGPNYITEYCSTAKNAIEMMAARRFDFVLCDVQMPEVTGLDLLKQINEEGLLEDGPTFVMMSAFGSLDTAIQCLSYGAYDYISKPFKRDEIRLTFAKAIERERLRHRVHELEEALNETYHFGNIVARSKAMHEVFEVLRKVAGYKTTVLITGESGTGKELIARALHYSSPRRNSRFVAVNCGAIPENLLETELFGHVRGAFTDAARDKTGLFEEADKGTLFLDEIGELPLGLQVKLLRVIQEQEVRRVGAVKSTPIDVRIVAATIRDLSEEVEENKFREDLYYRLNVIPIRVPPLRDRPEDIPPLLEHFLQRMNQRNSTGIKGFSQDAMRELVGYAWPGNVRELENTVERCTLLVESDVITKEVLPGIVSGQHDPARMALLSGDLSIKRTARIVEEALIRRALEETGGNRTHAAKILEISHRALLYKIKDYGVDT